MSTTAARWLPILVLLAALAGPAPRALAKSSLLLPFPKELGPVPAVTFDEAGKEIGRLYLSQADDRLATELRRCFVVDEEGAAPPLIVERVAG